MSVVKDDFCNQGKERKRNNLSVFIRELKKDNNIRANSC